MYRHYVPTINAFPRVLCMWHACFCFLWIYSVACLACPLHPLVPPVEALACETSRDAKCSVKPFLRTLDRVRHALCLTWSLYFHQNTYYNMWLTCFSLPPDIRLLKENDFCFIYFWIPRIFWSLRLKVCLTSEQMLASASKQRHL